MAFRSGLPPIQLLLLSRKLSRPILASSAAAHAVAFAIAAWVTWEPAAPQFRAPPLEVTRQYAIQYFVLPPVRPKPATQPERRPVSRRGRLVSIKQPDDPPTPASAPEAGGNTAPLETGMLAMELPAGSIASVGAADVAEGPDAAHGPDLLARLGFSVPGAAGPAAGRDPRPGLIDGDPESRGGSQVAELLTAAGTACPSLRRPPSWKERDVTVSIAFVVDQRGIVEPRTLRVVQSPERPQTDYRYYSHIYAVSSTARIDGKLRDLAAAYDSVMTDEVMSHVANLLFRPATRDGQPIPSTVLVSCQSP